jgi:imidazolonepropionase-like amidohydrolase
MGITVETWPEAKAKLEAQFESQHPDVQKITYDDEGWGSRPLIPILPKDLLQHIIEFYNDHGARTTVHVSNESRAREAIFSGVDSLAHTPVQGPVTEAFVKLAAAKQTPMVSTMTIGDNYGRVHEHPEYLDQPLYVATMSAEDRAALKHQAATGGETAFTSGAPEFKPRSSPLFQRTWRMWMQVQGPILQDNLRRIDAAGGVIAAGTDTSNGAETQRELELLAQAGIPNLEVIKIATYNGARLLGKQQEMGSVEEGKLADAVMLNADPTRDINNCKSIALVMKSGDIIDESKLTLAGGPQKRRWPKN